MSSHINLPESDRLFARELVLRCLRSELPAGAALPDEIADWRKSGLDSMACVAVESCIARALNSPSVFDSLNRAGGITTEAAIEAVNQILLSRARQSSPMGTPKAHRNTGTAPLTGWGTALGSHIVLSARVEQEFGLSSGALGKRAAIEQIRRASPNEDEISLAALAAEKALCRAGVSVQDLSYIVGTSETLLGLPSFAASVHTRLLAPSACRVLEIGGGCAGVVNCLAVADSLLAAGRADCVLVVSGDVHSRLLIPGRVPGEFGGLFGDGASALVLGPRPSGEQTPFSVLATADGCTGTYASALQIRVRPDLSFSLTFEGEALALAAVHQMEQILRNLEITTGRSRDDACAFAFHQPNPRLLETLVQQARLAPLKVPVVARTCGNLGSSTCGVALSMALEEHSAKSRAQRGPIFIAAVGPGLVWAGAVLE